MVLGQGEGRETRRENESEREREKGWGAHLLPNGPLLVVPPPLVMLTSGTRPIPLSPPLINDELLQHHEVDHVFCATHHSQKPHSTGISELLGEHKWVAELLEHQ